MAADGYLCRSGGLNGGFVLRNVSSNLSDHADLQFDQIRLDDIELWNLVGINASVEGQGHHSVTGIAYCLSKSVGAVYAHELMVVSGVFLIFFFIIAASAMRWSLTGQLLCNVPPSIIESFFTMILLTGHYIDEEKRRNHLTGFYTRRRKLISVLDVAATTKTVDIIVQQSIKEE